MVFVEEAIVIDSEEMKEGGMEVVDVNLSIDGIHRKRTCFAKRSNVSNLDAMQRRNFLRVVGGVSLTSLVPMSYVWGRNNPALSSSGVLLEASAFKELGGWKLDTQHYQQMGGNYLLAHGMCKPVANATTKVKQHADRMAVMNIPMPYVTLWAGFAMQAFLGHGPQSLG